MRVVAVGVAGLLAVAASMVGAAPTPATAAEPAPSSCSVADPFAGTVPEELTARYPGHRLTAAALDLATGCAYSFRPDERVTTASVLKVELYAGILLRAQREGRWLTPAEAAAAWPMITESANPPASSFFVSLGGVAGVDGLSRSFGMTETHSASTWGLTVTSANDQLTLLRQVVAGIDGPLEPSYRQALVDAMQAVVPSQRWGITAGVPPGWTVALKNGFADSHCCGWRTNSVGMVSRTGGPGYLVAILTDGWRTQAEGVAAVELISQTIAARLAAEPYAGFPSRTAFVEQMHADVVGGPPSLTTLVWLSAAAGWDGSAIGPLVDGLLGVAASGRVDLVSRLYRGLLGRAPDANAVAYWKDVVRSGGPVALTNGMLATTELRAATAHLDDAGFVAWVYERLLGRAVDGPGAAFWVGEVTRTGRAEVLAALASTAEATARLGHEAVVVQVYDALLHRLPSATEIDGWRRTDRAGLAAAVIGSDEYRG